MKTTILSAMIALTAGSIIAADPSPQEAITNACKALGEKANYSWRTTVVVPEDAQYKPSPTDGKTEKDGLTHYSMSFFDNPFNVYQKGDKAAFPDQDGNWQSLAESANAEGPGAFLGQFVRNLRTPVIEAEELAGATTELKKDGDAYVSDLTEQGAKQFLSFRRDPKDANVSNAKGSVKFWLKDGELTKYEFKVKGTVDWNGNPIDSDRTTTVEIKDVGTTKVEIPEDAKKKLS